MKAFRRIHLFLNKINKWSKDRHRELRKKNLDKNKVKQVLNTTQSSTQVLGVVTVLLAHDCVGDNTSWYGSGKGWPLHRWSRQLARIGPVSRASSPSRCTRTVLALSPEALSVSTRLALVSASQQLKRLQQRVLWILALHIQNTDAGFPRQPLGDHDQIRICRGPRESSLEIPGSLLSVRRGPLSWSREPNSLVLKHRDLHVFSPTF